MTGMTGNGELLVWRDEDEKPAVIALETKPGDQIFEHAPMSAVLTGGGSEVAIFYRDGRVQVWNTEPGVKVKDLECDRKNLSYGRLSANGQFVACLSSAREGQSSAILLWNTRDWTAAGRIETPERINDYCFTADGKQVIACVGHPTDQKDLGFTGIIAWDLASRKEESRIEYGSGFPIRIAVSADGRWVATGGGDAVPTRPNARRLSGHLRIFDWKAQKFQGELYTLATDYVRAVQFSPDSKSLYSGSYSTPPGGGQYISAIRAHRTGEWVSQWEATLGHGNPHEFTVSPNGKDLLVPDSEKLHIVNAEDGVVRGTKLTFRF
ncbi:MAG: WD40 repeat domain-containing protein [Planctomycetaceae bacterium]|nr:WD40 repeat domain-containing protein [Planctomycetaceae bacterium]